MFFCFFFSAATITTQKPCDKHLLSHAAQSFQVLSCTFLISETKLRNFLIILKVLVKKNSVEIFDPYMAVRRQVCVFQDQFQYVRSNLVAQEWHSGIVVQSKPALSCIFVLLFAWSIASISKFGMFIQGSFGCGCFDFAIHCLSC